MNVATPSRAVRLCVKQPHLHLPVMRGVIERRMLLNFQCDPLVLSRILPAPFRPKLVKGWGNLEHEWRARGRLLAFT